MLLEGLVSRATVCLHRLAASEAEERRFTRWLRHDAVTIEELRRAIQQRASGQRWEGHVLAIQDSTEVNFRHHAGKVSGLGAVGNGKDIGLFLHPVLGVDAGSGACLGLVDAQVWTRPVGGKTARPGEPEDRESQRWLDGARAAQDTVWQAACVTVVADRESDCYPLLAFPRPPRHHFLIRAAQDRSLVEGGTLMPALNALPIAGQYSFTVTAQPERQDIAGKTKPGRSERCATMAVRFAQVTIKKPGRQTGQDLPAEVKVSAVDVREIAPPAGEAPIHWRLLTSHAVETLDQAQEVVGWYRRRWQIEQLFRTLKRQGLNLEASQVETAGALLKLSLLAVQAATIIMQLVQTRDGLLERPAEDAFTSDEIDVLDALQTKLQGRTEKQRNPHQPRSLAWASWTIARLGGWKGYASRKPYGPITIHHGLQRFRALYEGTRLAVERQIVRHAN